MEFYFADANLVKDTYLRSRMDDAGFVPLAVLAGFHRLRVFVDPASRPAMALLATALDSSALLQVRATWGWGWG